MGLFEELSLSYPLEEVEHYGRVLVVSSKLFRLEWQKRLESEGVKVYSGAHGSQACFFLKPPANVLTGEAAPVAVEAPKPDSQVRASRLQTVWTKSDMEALLKLRSEGLSFEEIGKRLGKTGGACYAKWKRLAGQGTPSTSRSQLEPWQAQEDPVQEFLDALNLLYPKHRRVCLYLLNHALEVIGSER